MEKISLPLIRIICVSFVLIGRTLSAQQFENLDFEGTWSDGSIPGWTANYYIPGFFNGGTGYFSSYVYFDEGIIDENAVVLYDSTPRYFQLIDGSQSLYLTTGNGAYGTGGQPPQASISQVGTIPTGTKSITLLAIVLDGALDVSFDGNAMPLVPISNPGLGYVFEYSADISAYAGQTGTLSISSVSTGFEGAAEIDDVNFSKVATPAPEAKSFTVFSAVLCLFVALIPTGALKKSQ
jgi:hypothetical protein